MVGFDWRYSAVVWLAAFMLWAAFSLFWSPDPRTGAIQLGKLGLFACVFYLARLVEFKIGLIAAIAVVIIGYGHFWGEHYAGFGNENFEAELLLCLVPFLLKPRYLPFLGMIIVMLATSDSKSALLVIWVAVLVYLAWKRMYTWSLCWALLPFALLVYFEPISPLESINSRIEFTFNTLLLWISAPVFGHGLGSFGFLYPIVQGGAQEILGIPTAMRPGWFAGAAHNEYVQILMELGVAGLALLGWFLWCCVRMGRWGPERLCLCVLAVIGAIGFPWQLPATMALAAICLGREAGAVPKLSSVAAPLFVLGLLGVVWQYHALQAHRMFGYTYYFNKTEVDVPSAFGYALLAHRIYPWDWHIRYQLYLTLTRLATEHEVIFKGNSLQKVYEISASASPFSPELMGARRVMEER